MADFTKRSEHNPKTNFTSVLFGANAPLLEIELNEMQQIAEEKRAQIIKLLTKVNDEKVVYIAEEQVESFTSNMTNTITIPKFDIFFKNQIINVPSGNYSVPFLVSLVNNNSGSSGDLYLAYKEEEANPSTVLNENAVRGATTVPNKIQDTRLGTETTRRTLIKFGGIGSDTSLSTAVSEGYTLVKLLKITKVNGKLVFTLDANAGYFRLTPYSLVGASGSPYSAILNLNDTSLKSGFYLVNNTTSNRPIPSTGTVMLLNSPEVRMTVFFSDDGRVFTRASVLAPTFSVGTWTEVSVADLPTTIRGTVLSGFSLNPGAVTSSDTIISALGKLQKQYSDLSTYVDTGFGTKANLASPTFTGTVSGITSAMVGLGKLSNFDIATQAEAESGTIGTKYMTPQRTKQTVLANLPSSLPANGGNSATVNNKTVLKSVPSNAEFTDTITTINGKTGVITKADIQALGIGGDLLSAYQETLVTLTSLSINLNLGNVFYREISSTSAFTITNAKSGGAHSFTLVLKGTYGYAPISFPSSVRWRDDDVPMTVTVNTFRVMTFLTIDGGTTWLATNTGVY